MGAEGAESVSPTSTKSSPLEAGGLRRRSQRAFRRVALAPQNSFPPGIRAVGTSCPVCAEPPPATTPLSGDARFRDRPRDLHSVRSHPVPAARPKTHYTPRRPAPPPHRAASLSLDTPKTRRTTVLGLVLGLMRSNHLKFQQHSDPRARLQDRPRAKFQSTYSTKSTNRSIIGCIGWLKIGALFRTGRRTVQNVPRAWHSPRPSSKRAHVRVCWPFRESSGAPR